MAKITIKDVAREAGVSISTVSNALNDVDVLKPETKEHVLSVAKRLHYIPDVNGRNLKCKATKVIGLFVTSLKGPYFVTLADSIFRECAKYGYELNVFVTENNTSAMNNILGRRVDGCIVLGTANREQDMGRIRDYEIPVVFLDREYADEKLASVVFDSEHDGRMAAEYFIKKGAKKLGFIKGFPGNYDAVLRLKGFQERLCEAGISLESDYILDGFFEKEKAYESVDEFLRKKLPLPDAIFAANDLSAIGAMEALQKAGIKIPEDVMVLGVDGIEQNQWYRPTVSSIETGFEKQGCVAVEKLMHLINGDEQGVVVKLPGNLIERESTKRIK